MGWLRKALVSGIEGMLNHWERSLNVRIDRNRRKAKRQATQKELPSGHLRTDDFVRSLVRSSMVGRNGEVSMAVKSWKAANRKSFVSGKFEDGAEQRYLVNPEALSAMEVRLDQSQEPEAFRKQREWEAGLIPGRLYQVARDLKLMPRFFQGTDNRKEPKLKKGEILMLISVGGPETHCEKTGNFTTKYEPTLGDTYAVKLWGKRESGSTFTHMMVRTGMFGSKNFDDIYMPLAKQSWISGERVIDWSFTYDEVKEIESDELP